MKGDNARFLGSSPKKRWVIVVLPTMTTPYTEDSSIRRCLRILRIDCVIAASVRDRNVSRLSNRSAIRELKNLLASTLYAIEEQETIIDLQHLPERFLKRIHPRDTLDERYVPSTGSLKTILAHAERHAIREALKRSDQNRTLAARELNISRSNLYKRMAELGMKSG